MQKIVLDIDTKSLFYNIYNDNLSGHTATVSTPIKQGNSTNMQLMKVFDIPKQINYNQKPKLLDELMKNSKSKVKINNVFIFDKISVNGIELSTEEICFCIYVKEEVDELKAQYGRIKLHYPLSIKYEDEEININNKYIIDKISEHLKHYAFIINSFEYIFETDMLNFDVSIIGENNIPYSKVFINNKGVGNKFTNIFNENAETYDLEIVKLKQKFGQEIGPHNYQEYMEKVKEKAENKFIEEIKKEQITSLNTISRNYPYSLYDFEYIKNNKKRFVLLFYTTTTNEYFNISSKKLKFLNDYLESIDIYIFTNVLENITISKYSVEEIMTFSKSINSIMMRK